MVPQFDLKTLLEIITLLIGIAAFIHKLASFQTELFKTIDKTNDELFEKYSKLNYRLSMHVTRCEQKDKNMNFILNEIRQQLEKMQEKGI